MAKAKKQKTFDVFKSEHKYKGWGFGYKKRNGVFLVKDGFKTKKEAVSYAKKRKIQYLFVVQSN